MSTRLSQLPMSCSFIDFSSDESEAQYIYHTSLGPRTVPLVSPPTDTCSTWSSSKSFVTSKSFTSASSELLDRPTTRHRRRAAHRPHGLKCCSSADLSDCPSSPSTASSNLGFTISEDTSFDSCGGDSRLDRTRSPPPKSFLTSFINAPSNSSNGNSILEALVSGEDGPAFAQDSPAPIQVGFLNSKSHIEMDDEDTPRKAECCKISGRESLDVSSIEVEDEESELEFERELSDLFTGSFMSFGKTRYNKVEKISESLGLDGGSKDEEKAVELSGTLDLKTRARIRKVETRWTKECMSHSLVMDWLTKRAV